MIDIEDWELKTVFGNPLALYEAITSHKTYTPKPPAADGDCEFLATEFVGKGHVLCCVMVHSRQEAHLVMLSSADCTAMRERLGELQSAMNAFLLFRSGA
jgi:hypothetical protein